MLQRYLPAVHCHIPTQEWMPCRRLRLPLLGNHIEPTEVCQFNPELGDRPTTHNGRQLLSRLRISPQEFE